MLRLSPEAVNLSLRLLDLDIEDAQAAAEAIVRSQLVRGRFEEALASARASRMQSLRFREKIMSVIRQTRRDVDRLDWRDAVPALLQDAIEHVARRLDAEAAILEVAQERLELLSGGATDGGKTRGDTRGLEAVARVAAITRECRLGHVELHEHLMVARNAFLDAQARQSFVPAPLTPRPDLAAEVLEPLFKDGLK